MSHKPDLSIRVEVIETQLVGLSKNVDVLIAEFRKDMEDRSHQRPSIPFREIMISIAATVGVLATCATFAHQWVQLVTSEDRGRVSRIERTLDAVTKTVIRPERPESK